MTTPSLAAVPGTVRSERARITPHPALPLRVLTGAALLLAVIFGLELAGRPAGIEPQIVVPLVVAATMLLGGVTAAIVAGVLGALYTFVYYDQSAWVGTPGNLLRVVLTVLASAAFVWLIGWLQERLAAARSQATAHAERRQRLLAFAARLAEEPLEALPDALVLGAANVLAADMAVLTILDPASGRHFVRSVHGTDSSAIGVEVLPGVGITGQAIREQRLLVSGGTNEPGNVAWWRRRLAGRSTTAQQPQVVAAVPGMQAGRVVATLTVGRSDPERPFDGSDREAIEDVIPLVTLSVTASLARREVEEGSPRDPTTGLYNRAFLEAALEQLLALRRRTPPEERQPLSLIMFDVDDFRLINERHGRQVGDHVLRAVATLLRQRFRASDTVARVGADSFVVVLNGASAEVASDAAAHVRRQVRNLSVAGAQGERVPVSISAGCALVRDVDRSDVLFRSVEAALATARWSGPGAVVSI